MGDGVLNLNVRHNILEKTGNKFIMEKGDNLVNKPFTADSFLKDKLDKIRTNFYHEFGHHIHQQKFVKNA